MMDILYDVDGVVRDFVRSVYITLKYYFPDKVPAKPPTHTEWDMHKVYPKFEKKEFYDLIFKKYAEDVFYINASPHYEYAGSIDKIREFPLVRYIFIRTHQDYARICPTIRFLQTFNILDKVDGLFYTDSDIPKNIISNAILIDDKPENIIDHGMKTSVLISRRWNGSLYTPYRANSQSEMLKHIKTILKKEN